MKPFYIVLGASGYIGRKFIKFLDKKRERYIGLSRDVVDYTDSHVFEEWVVFNYPRWKSEQIFVINCAGKTGRPNVDQCEIKKSDTIKLNVVLPAMLSSTCQRHNLIYCHVSSGCIYTGTQDRIFTELDPPNFCFNNKNHSFYSGSKALAEEYISQNPKSYIWRIRMPFDETHGKRNYLSKLLNYSKLIDATNTLTHIGDFIQTCYDMMRTSSPYGIYNIVNDGYITTKEITKMMNEELELDKHFEFFDTHKDFNNHVKTPRSNCVLSCEKVNKLTNVTPMRDVREAISGVLKSWSQDTIKL